MRHCAGDRHRVSNLEDGIPCRAGRIDRVGLCVLACVDSVLNFCAAGEARFQRAELVRQAVIILLVRQDDDVRTQTRKLLSPVRDGSLERSVCVEPRSVHPVQPVVRVEPVRFCECAYLPTRAPRCEQGIEVARHILHVPDVAVVCAERVVVPAELCLLVFLDTVLVCHWRQADHAPSPPNRTKPSSASR